MIAQRQGLPVLLAASLALAVVSVPATSEAFWLLGFSSAPTLPPGGVGFIGGTGGQVTSVGNPSHDSFTPFLTHFGIRVGLANGVDIGYRLCTVPLPYSSAGPTLGGEIDLKFRLTPRDWAWQLAVVGGMAYAGLDLSDQSRDAWSPGAAVTLSRDLSHTLTFALGGRYVYTAIPSAMLGIDGNHIHAFGGSVNLRIALTDAISVIPEVGVFRFVGALDGAVSDGWAMQYGAVLSARIR